MRYYFAGIAGTAMASLAVLLKKKGHSVWGSDQGIYPPMSDFLADNDIEVIQGFSEANLERPFDSVVIGNALSRGNLEVEAILSRRLPFTSMPELIRREFTGAMRNIVISGTHGKTTTTTLMSWILESAGRSPSFMIGGISRNFNSSVQLGNGAHFVIEGDEYDCAFFDKRPKFAHYFPEHLVINNLEFDHADIYPDLAAIQDVFRKVIRVVPQNGLIVANTDSPGVQPILDPLYSRLQTFGRSAENHWSYRIHGIEDGLTRFEIREKGDSRGTFHFPFPGEYQIQNAVAATAVARDIGIKWEELRKAFASFKGVKRRLERWGSWNGAEVYDDFAHHPSAIAATLNAVRERFPGKRLIALFEPRTNTTVRAFFQDRLPQAFASADLVILLPPHRQERLPEDDRLSIPRLEADLKNLGREVLSLTAYEGLEEVLSELLGENDLLLLLTNGSLGGQYQGLRDCVTEK